MRIIVNGEAQTVAATTLEALLLELGYQGAIVATALNRDFVPCEARADTPLAEGDAVEIIAPMQGG
ncbi:sulfur carrier protein ThiS [Aurantimonas sp. HBX-1]|uniref:sulfur carrier protein ThiS n=1 Tax=Aurantimonas sp. HBX-1 TaxID=2906072 RepID=UPI001F3C62FE|nr:sulfur carrier protein ThiS [Aurantimonas sp. HBX-1]UIJ71609.1 sulfur carrier protein ThiS [Aurantimonas sp. HBX-1]